MKSDIMKVIAIALIGAIIVAVVYVNTPRGPVETNPTPPPPPPTEKAAEEITIIDGKTNVVVVTAPTVRSVARRPLEPEATKRLHEGPVVISSLLEASGLAEHASYGKAIRGSYLYTTTVIAQSEVKEKSEDMATGKVRVVECRKFLQARDSIALSDVDVALALDTLPLDQAKVWVDNKYMHHSGRGLRGCNKHCASNSSLHRYCRKWRRDFQGGDGCCVCCST